MNINQELLPESQRSEVLTKLKLMRDAANQIYSSGDNKKGAGVVNVYISPIEKLRKKLYYRNMNKV